MLITGPRMITKTLCLSQKETVSWIIMFSQLRGILLWNCSTHLFWSIVYWLLSLHFYINYYALAIPYQEFEQWIKVTASYTQGHVALVTEVPDHTQAMHTALRTFIMAGIEKERKKNILTI